MTFEPGDEETRITLVLETEPKLELAPLRKLLLCRRLGDSLRSRLTRFSYELAAERPYGASR